MKIYGAEESVSSVIVETDLSSLRKLDECVQRLPILEDLAKEQASTITELKSSLANKDELLSLEKKENEINVKMLAIKDMEIAAINRNFEQMKEVADRAIELAKTSKPSSNIWTIISGFFIGLASGLAIAL